MKIPLRILMVEDSEDDAFLTLNRIRKGNYDVECEIVQTAGKMEDALREKHWDVILCDYSLPGFNGFAALEIFKRSELDIPFIVISGTIGEEIAVECMKAGADDYLMKGNLTRLIPAIERGSREAGNRAEKKRLEAEQKRSESELRFRNILLSTQQEVSIDGILVVDETGKTLSCNRNFLAMWGTPPDGIGSQTEENATRMVARKLADPAGFLLKAKHLVEHKKETSRDEVSLKDGRTIDCYSAPMFGPDDEYYGRVWYFRDITERIKAEEEKKRAETRRFELERELLQSQKFESLGTLASGIAHDFNNILAIILGFSSLGEQGAFKNPPEAIRGFETISLACRRGALLVRQLLTFARKTETSFQSTDLNALITDVVKLFRETFPKSIRISAVLQKSIPHIIADVAQLHQVFMNLCVNARDAMPKGGTLRIATSVSDHADVKSRFPKAASQRYISISISDTGSGMDENTKRRIFDPFFTTKEPGKGTGLGLAVVHSILETHHGLIDVESEPGKGTVFHLYLPIEESAVELTEPAKDFENTPPILEIVSGETKTVLLVEDEDFIIEMARIALIRKGYSVLLAQDGEEGVAMYARHHKEIAAVLLDYGLPGLRGDEVASRIKSMDPDADIILMSGFFDPEIKAAMARIGVNRFLQKPFSFAELTDALLSPIPVAT